MPIFENIYLHKSSSLLYWLDFTMPNNSSSDFILIPATLLSSTGKIGETKNEDEDDRSLIFDCFF